ncbi:hypothetical protein HQQ81_06890 [Microbacteriaceae bacterium VKM Ac-2854]|nr:hypothetical protein [Microbacteriaceae bacterium VKM Ac-2854]
MTNPNLPESENADERAGTSRRLLVGTAGLVAAAGLTATVASPAGAWAAPAVKQILGLPRSSASGTVSARVRFDGTQTVSNASGTSVTLPSSIVFTNTSPSSTIPAGAAIALIVGYEGRALILDREASATAAQVNGVVDAGQVIVAGSRFVVQLALEPGATVVVPILATAMPMIPALGDSTAQTAYEISGADESPVQDRTDEAVTTISDPAGDPVYYDISFRGTRRTAPSASGASWDYPAFLTITRGPQPHPNDIDGSFTLSVSTAVPFQIGGATPTLNGVEDAGAGVWAGDPRNDTPRSFTVQLPLAEGDVVEFPLYAVDAKDATGNWSGAYTVTLENWSVSDGPAPTATTTITPAGSTAEFFDAALTFTGTGSGTRSLPATLEIAATNAEPVPVGTVVRMPIDYRAPLLTSVGPATINGSTTPDAVAVVLDAAYELNVWNIVTRAEVPAGAAMSIPLSWRGTSSSKVTATLVTTGRDADLRNNSATN